MLSHSRQIDARRSKFANAGRDQYNTQNINIIIAKSSPAQILHGLLRNLDGPPSSTSSSETLSQRGFSYRAHHSGTGSAGDIAASLIVKIVQLVINRTASPDDYGGLKQQLEILHQTLTLTGLAVQTYEYTPLGQNLADSIIPEVEKCCDVLQGLFDVINSYQQGLSPTSIRDLWRQVWWSGCDMEGLDLLRMKLSAHQQSLGTYLVAFNSVQWTKLGNGLRAGSVSLTEFHTCLRQGPRSLRHIQVQKILVVDHLGQNIPVPTIFCSTWEGFNYIIQGHCKNRLGDHHVMRGNYEVIHGHNNKTISPFEFANTVEPGMVLEMSIILRQHESFQDNKEKCPRCHHINLNATVTSGWINCCQCAGQFHVGLEHEDEDEDLHGEDSDPRIGDKGDEERGRKNNGKSSAGRNGESDDKVIDGEIISHASRKSGSEKRQPDDDCTKFFRRIHVIFPMLNAPTMTSFPSSSATVYLSPPTAEEETPYKDLTNQVVKTENYYFAYGGFSEIYKGVWTNPLTGDVTKVAIKLFRGVHTNDTLLARTIRRLNRDTRIWHSLSHKNVVPVLGLCSDIGPSPAIISPLYDNGDVLRYLVSNPQANRLEIIIGVAHGLQYLHSKNVVHGNLKGHNVLIDDDGTPRLSDFARSKFIDHGSSRYMAPEITIAESDVNYDDDDDPVNRTPPNSTKETDVFAFSMVALEILTGKLPFFYIRQDTAVIAFVQNGKRPERSRCLPTIFADPVWELLVNCWDEDPGRRLDMGTVVQRLKQM